MFAYKFKPRLWPTVLTGFILFCLLALGFWQIHRLEWKLGLIAQIEERAFMVPAELEDLPELFYDELEYQSVQITGTFNNDKEMTLYSIGPNGEPGYDLYTPLSISDGWTVIVNRGWVPEKLKSKIDRPQTLVDSEITVEGLLRKQGQKLWYGPDNEPQNNNWYYSNLDEMAVAQNMKNVYPFYLYAAKIDGNNKFPVAGRTEVNIVNNHLDYVLTWFGLAIVLLVIYVITHTEKRET